MSTNNNYLGKEIQPRWKSSVTSETHFTKIRGAKLQTYIANTINEITALSLAHRGVERIDDLAGFDKLLRLDLSHNSLRRLQGMADAPHIGLLNVSHNQLESSSSLEDLRYLPELRTLNIGFNPAIAHLESHVVKPLHKLQAFIANECGFTKISFVRFLSHVNTLVLSKNAISSFPSDVTFLHLTKLSLGHNQLTSIPSLTNMPQLTELRLNNNHISAIIDSLAALKHLKTLDISHNNLSDWDNIRLLTQCKRLTNLSLHHNPLPTPPAIDIQLREDISADKISQEERIYRHYVLAMFQDYVGAEAKPHIRLIVLDMKRVKFKWSHKDPAVEISLDSKKPSEKRKHKDEEQKDVEQKERVKSFQRNEKKSRKKSKLENDVPLQSSVDLQNEDIVLPSPVSPAAALDAGVVAVKVVKKKKEKKQQISETESRAESLLFASQAAMDLGRVGAGGESEW